MLASVQLLSLILAIYSVDSCSVVSRSGVSLTGVCPNDSFIVPVGTTLSYECSYGGFREGYVPYWNVSGTPYNFFNYKPPDINVKSDGTSLEIMTKNTSEYYIQCGLCGEGEGCLRSDLQEYIAAELVQLIAFGPPSSLSHEIRDNDTVKLSWSTPSLPPSVNEDDVSFTYNIIIMESTNSSLTVADINITNNTYVIISPANINGYAKCTSYQWGIRAAGSLSYGFTNVTMAKENFTLISGSEISNELTVINYTTIEFNVTGPCDIDDMYTLSQRDYCQTPLNSSQLNISTLNVSVVLINMLISISVNIGSLIHDSTWSVAVNVSDRFGSDATDYTNITDNSEIIQNCNPMTSSSVLQESSSNILSSLITYTVYPFSSPTPSVTPSGESDRSSWTSTDTALVVFGGGLLVCIAVVIYVVMYKMTNNRTSCNIQNVVDKVKGLKLNDTSMVVEPSSRVTVKSSPVGSADIGNEDYDNAETSFQTHQDPLPLSPNEEAEATPDSELATHQYADLDEIRSMKRCGPPPIVLDELKYSQSN